MDPDQPPRRIDRDGFFRYFSGRDVGSTRSPLVRFGDYKVPLDSPRLSEFARPSPLYTSEFGSRNSSRDVWSAGPLRNVSCDTVSRRRNSDVRRDKPAWVGGCKSLTRKE